MRIVRRPVPEADVPLLADLPPLLRRLYLVRGVRQGDEIAPDLRGLLPPDGLSGVHQAAELLRQALAEGWRILIVGDYDADGATACALGVRVLRAFGAAWVDYRVSNRFVFGYGLSPELAERVAADDAPHLLVTVDNGIASLTGVARARQLGMRVLITDHHLPGETLPDADAMVNPNLPGDPFPSKHLAGVGVLFYLLSVLRLRLREAGWFAARRLPEPNLADYLDLVALGTVADVVPLDRNNRILVEQGLRRIRAGRCGVGIQALLQVAGRPRARAVTNDLAFGVGPRLNAAGRLQDMGLGVECLLADDPAQALEQARTLDGLNRERRQIETEMKGQAEEWLGRLSLEGQRLPLGLCLFDERWHQGVIGILAARIRERYHRPVIALAVGDADSLKGSARSIPGLHIRDLLARLDSRHAGLLDRFGGHAMAAGLTLRREHVDAFRQAFETEVRHQLGDREPHADLFSDGPLAEQDLTVATARLLRYAAPWGQAFPEPLFDGEFHILEARRVGQGDHLRLRLALDPQGPILDGVAFRWGEQELPRGRARLAYRLDLDEYRGTPRAQLVIEHLQALP